MKPHEGSLIDLTFLNRFAGGDPVKISRYINMFISYSDGHLKNLEESANKKDWDGVRATCHAFKPQYTYMGMVNLEKLVSSIESSARSNSNVDAIPVQIIELKQSTELAIRELEMVLNSLS